MWKRNEIETIAFIEQNIEKLLKQVTKYSIYHDTRITKKLTKTYRTRFSIKNIILHEKLIEYDFDLKTYKFHSKLFNDTPNNNIKHFILDFFDGDGHIGLTKKNVGRLELAFHADGENEKWIDYFNNNNQYIFKYKIKNTGKGAKLNLNKRTYCIKFYHDFIKNKYGLGLKRKLILF